MVIVNTGSTCQWCGQIHNAICPRVKAIDYETNGTIRRVEFFSPHALLPLPSQSQAQSSPTVSHQ